MTNGYLIVEWDEPVIVYFVATDDKERALAAYLSNEHEYATRFDGAYWGPAVEIVDVSEALAVYGISAAGNGAFVSRDGRAFSDIDAVKAAYGIVALADGRLLTHGPVYASLSEAVRHVPVKQIQVGPVRITGKSAFEHVATLESPPLLGKGEQLVAVSVAHRQQSERYAQLGLYTDAILELRRATATDARSMHQVGDYCNIARYYSELGRPRNAILAYRKALSRASEFDNRALIMYYVARQYERVGDTARALKWYLKINTDELDGEERNDLGRRVTEISVLRMAHG